MSRGGLGFRREPQGLHSLNNDDDLLTDEVEDDYDALNDETFGGGLGELDDGWEEVHEKFAELEDRAKHPPDSSSGAVPLAEEDPLALNQDVVQRSISHLGLEDDRDDDPAIMSYSKATASPWPAEWGRPSSPPPPAILQQQFGGSPKTETIWTPKPVAPPAPDDRLSSLLWKLQHQHPQAQQQALPKPQQQPQQGRSPLPPNVRTLEDLERDMLYSAGSHPVPIGSPRRETPWGSSGGGRAERPERGDFAGPSSPRSYPSSSTTANQVATPPVRRGSVDHVPSDVLPGSPFCGQPRSPQFRFNSPGRSAFPPGMHAAGPVPPAPPMGMSPPHGRMPGPPTHGRMSPGIHPPGFGNRMPLPPVPHPMLGRGRVMMPPPHCSPMLLNNPGMRGRMPLPNNMPGFQPGLNQVRFGPQNSGASPHYQQHAYQTVFGSPGGGVPFGSPHQGGGGGVPHIQHPYLRTQFPGTLDHRDGGSNGSFHPGGGNGGGNGNEQRSDDPYAGLMTQKEKDWLIKIQLLQVQPENPEVDDYYYVMSTKKKAERRESPTVDNGDGDKLRFIRPERVRTESKSYTPIQFERSLGKLQVVSVNYPRKILDMGVQRLSEDEERKVPPDRHLLWFRQLLLDIEKMYSAVLEHEDPSCSPERQAEIAQKLFQELHPSDERFVKVVGVRKGRSLALRVLPKLKPEQQVALMAALLRHLAWLQRRDLKDGVLDRGVPSALAVIQGAPTLSDLIQLAASLLMNPGAAFPGTFALRVACAMVARAEYHFGREDSSTTICNEVQRKWVKLLSEMADSLVSAHSKLSADAGSGEAEKRPDGLVTTLRLFPHERAALVSQLRRFAINFPLVSALSGDPGTTLDSSAAQGNLHLLHQQNGFGDSVLTVD
ncbi:protein associated with topo II related - 1 isoform X3 [Haemaphysalis longicornis]